MDPAAALSQWGALLGPGRVLTDANGLAPYSASTAARGTQPLAVLRPLSTEEVVSVVRIAAHHRMPLYPISLGHNWGYGDACAVRNGNVIVDLSGMQRIVEASADLAYVVVEPGVSQAQLSEYLISENLPLWMDSTGAGPDTSLVGNIMERGFGHSPYGNRFQSVCGMRIVLANGDVLNTGFGHFPTAVNQRVFPYGLGPFLDGLFTQSNLGIVTSLGLWLMPKTPAINHFLCMVPEHEDIGPVVDALRPLRLSGVLRSVLHIGNDLRVISGGMTFPHQLAPGLSRLPDPVRLQLRTSAGIGAWTVSGALYGAGPQLAYARSAVRAALARTRARVQFLDERKLAWGEAASRLLGNSAAGRKLRGQVALGRSLFDMNRGIPNGRFLAGAYWRRRGGLPPGFPAGANPAMDNCGLLWVSPVLPMRGTDMLRAHALADPVFRRHGFDLFATFSMINERALGGVLTIAFDKDDPAETARAHACHDELFDEMMAVGYIPYRVGQQSLDKLDNGDDAYWRTVARIKEALDPDHIIAPGRYGPG
ncbi:MAG TPA: FAD-binding oxidoreductase [Pseudoduganella sp.]